jgi:hypothetical protein
MFLPVQMLYSEVIFIKMSFPNHLLRRLVAPLQFAKETVLLQAVCPGTSCWNNTEISRLFSVCSKKMNSADSSEHVLVAVSESKAFIQRCMEKAGATSEHSQQMAEVLVMGDHRGHFSHGLNRLGAVYLIQKHVPIYFLISFLRDVCQRYPIRDL